MMGMLLNKRLQKVWIGGLLMVAMHIGYTQNLGSFHDAIESKDYTQIEALIESDTIDLEVQDFQARTPLMYATQLNDPKSAALLITAGANVNAKNAIKDTPYLLAGAEGYNEILKMTLENGADIEDTNRYGGTAIIPAAEKGHLETVKILLNAGLNPNHVNNLGWTALMEAVLLGDGSSVYVEIVEVLLKGGADPNIPDKKGITPLQFAKQKGYDALVKLLVANGGQ